MKNEEKQYSIETSIVLWHKSIFSFLSFLTIIVYLYGVGHSSEVAIGFDRDFAPFSFEDSRGEPTGFDVELLKAIFYKTQYTPVFKPLTWEMVQVQLSEGKIHIAPGFIKSPNTKLLFSFADKPYYSTTFRMFTKVKDRVPNIEWLRGKFIGVKQFSFAEDLLIAMKDMRSKTYATDLDAIRALYDEQVSGYLGMYSVGRWYAQTAMFEGLLAVGSPIAVEDMFFAVTLQKKELVQIVNSRFAHIKRSGEYDRIYRKWFVHEITKEQEKELIEQAKEVANFALAQYSKKPVGCALLTQSGKVYTGVSVESAEARDGISAIKSALSVAAKSADTEVRALVLSSPQGVIIEPNESDLRLLRAYDQGILVILPTVSEKEWDMKTVGQLLTSIQGR
ncbi:MAG: transporter substrate-binding domain-containing protein [Desulfovibrionaceae bacterium]|nr:transporter substrate-binding domain-containing protein [Desulfovibrionaceae bacterium]